MIEMIDSAGNVSSKISDLSGLTYINVSNPDSNEISGLSRSLGISDYILKDFLDQREIPRIEKAKLYDVIILKHLTDGKVKTLGILRNKKYVLTVCSDKFGFKPEKDHFKDSYVLLRKIVYKVIKDFYEDIEKIEEDVNFVEDLTFNERVNNDQKDIFKLKKLLFYRRKALHGNKVVVSEIKDFDEVSIELNQLIDMENTLTTRLTGIMDMYLTFTSNKLNKTMKGFTIIASLILIPTLISGIYGMNVILPLGNHSESFYIILGMMVVSIIILLIYFKIRKWV